MTGATLERTDHQLVAAVRRGDERAFEALYERYQRRIYSFALGMVNDHGRAEDVTQEVFLSALRRMRATERPIAFKPWIYEIAKNACIDAFLTGEPREHITADAAELGMTFVAAGHYATETFGVRAVGDLLAERFGVEHRFVELPNPV